MQWFPADMCVVARPPPLLVYLLPLVRLNGNIVPAHERWLGQVIILLTTSVRHERGVDIVICCHLNVVVRLADAAGIIASMAIDFFDGKAMFAC